MIETSLVSVSGKVTEGLNLEMKAAQVKRIEGYSTDGEIPPESNMGIAFHYMEVSGGSSENAAGLGFIIRTIWDCRYEILQGALSLLNKATATSSGTTASSAKMKVDDSEI